MDKVPTESLDAKLSRATIQENGLKDRSVDGDPLRRTSLQLWLHRLLVLLLVFVCAAMGVLLLILPWRPEWTDNHFLLGSPALRAFVSNGFVRGLCSGLWLLGILVWVLGAVHYHDANRR